MFIDAFARVNDSIQTTKSMKPKSNPPVSRPLASAAALCALASFTIAGSASAATLLFSDNFDSERVGASVFNDATALTADQSGTAATKTYAIVHTGWDGAYQRGNGGTWLMHANGTFFDNTNTNSRGSLNYDIAAAANTLNSALEIKFNMTVTLGVTAADWTSFTVGTQNPFVNASTVGFGSLFRDGGGTQQFSNTTLDNGNASDLGAAPTFTDGDLISFVFSDATGFGSAFSDSNGANDIVKMYVNGSLTNTFTGLNLGTDDQFISFHANSTVANIDNLTISAIPEPSAALLGGLGLLALLRRRRA